MSALRVDAHHHVWDLAVLDQPWTRALPVLHRSFAFEELAPQLRAAGIDATVVVQTAAVRAETEALVRLAAQRPEIAGVVGWVDLTDPGVADRIAALRDSAWGGALVGVRHSVQALADGGWLARPEVRRGLSAVGEHHLAYDLLVRWDQLPAAVTVAAAHPGLRFVLDHAGKPDIVSGDIEPWARHVVALARQPNVAVKLSGLTGAAGAGWTTAALEPCVTVLLEAFGPRRILFGSDWPVCLLSATYCEVVEAAEELTGRLSVQERERVFGGTAVEWYGLPGRATR